MTEVPLYGKVEEVLASEIARGDIRPGDRLPSEDELLTRFAVSRITVRRAIQNLIQRGIVESNITVEGRGKREPVVTTADGISEPMNRRVEINVR